MSYYKLISAYYNASEMVGQSWEQHNNDFKVLIFLFKDSFKK